MKRQIFDLSSVIFTFTNGIVKFGDQVVPESGRTHDVFRVGHDRQGHTVFIQNDVTKAFEFLHQLVHFFIRILTELIPIGHLSFRIQIIIQLRDRSKIGSHCLDSV